MVDYPKNFDENGIFCCRDIRELPQQNYNDLAPQGIVSMLQCAIRDEGRMIGFVGFDECRVSRMWTDGQARALSLVASLLGNQLVKERLKERLALLERELAQGTLARFDLAGTPMSGSFCFVCLKDNLFAQSWADWME